MARLSLSLLGLFQARLDDQPVIGFESAKTRALLAYLADTQDQATPRSMLAGMLWPERPEAVALGNLRHVLANLRNAIHDAVISPPFLIIDRETVARNPYGDCSVDTQEFRSLVGVDKYRKQEKLIYLDDLKQAVSLYHGEFLHGFKLHNSPDFEEWIHAQREMYHEQFLDALYMLAEASLSQGDYFQTKVYAQRQIEMEAWCEEAHRQLMQALVLEGRRSEALKHYASLVSVLKRELGVEPSQETQELLGRIRDRS